MKTSKRNKRYAGYLEVNGPIRKKYRICNVFLTKDALVLTTVISIA